VLERRRPRRRASSMNRWRLADCGRRPRPFFTRRVDDSTTSRIMEVMRPSLETAMSRPVQVFSCRRQSNRPVLRRYDRRRDTVITHLGSPSIDGVRHLDHLDREVPGLHLSAGQRATAWRDQPRFIEKSPTCGTIPGARCAGLLLTLIGWQSGSCRLSDSLRASHTRSTRHQDRHHPSRRSSATVGRWSRR
jgi:hypothetical protein